MTGMNVEKPESRIINTLFLILQVTMAWRFFTYSNEMYRIETAMTTAQIENI